MLSRESCVRNVPRDTEIEDLYEIVGAQHQVLRLSVAMHDSVGVRGRQSLGYLPAPIRDSLQRIRLPTQSMEGCPLHQLHHDGEGRTRADDFMDRDDARMIQCRSGLRLANELLNHTRAADATPRQKLQGNLPVQLRIPSRVNFAHAAAAQWSGHYKAPDGLAELLPLFNGDGGLARCMGTGGRFRWLIRPLQRSSIVRILTPGSGRAPSTNSRLSPAGNSHAAS